MVLRGALPIDIVIRAIEMNRSVRVVRMEWWLDVTGLPDLLWARLSAFVDGHADVLDLDGELHEFAAQHDARYWLLEDEYEPLESVNDDDIA